MRFSIALLSLLVCMSAWSQRKTASTSSQDLYRQAGRQLASNGMQAMDKMANAYKFQFSPGRGSDKYNTYSFSDKYSSAAINLAQAPEYSRKQVKQLIQTALLDEDDLALPKMSQEERAYWEDVSALMDNVDMSGRALTQEARTAGDPHLRTLDGLNYDFQTVGEYILCKSANRDFEIQVRQRAVNEYVSLNSAVAVNVHGQKVQFFAEDPQNNTRPSLKINCEPIVMDAPYLLLPNGGAIQKNVDNQYTVMWETGESVSVMISDYIDLALSIPRNFHKKIGGLLGNNNGNPADDFQGSQGAVLNIQHFGEDVMAFQASQLNRTESAERDRLTQAQIANQFGYSWRVLDSSSLFCYPTGMSTASFSNPNFPAQFRSIHDLTPAQYEAARQTCLAAGVDSENLNACIYDVGFTNQKKFVQSGLFFQQLKSKEATYNAKYPVYVPPTPTPVQKPASQKTGAPSKY